MKAFSKMNETKLKVRGDFDGANPRENGIERTGDRKFVIHAYTENEIEAHRVETLLCNEGHTVEQIHLDIHWPIEAFTQLKDCLYIKHEKENDWTLVTGMTKPGHTFLTFNVQPGKTYLCLHPHYGYEDYEAFIEGLNHLFVHKKVAGRSDKDRVIWQLTLTNPDTTTKQPILIVARNHANETSGNYCIEGMIEYLLSDDPLAKYALGKFEFHFLPMTNVDGVADGMERLTGKNGADMNRDLQWHQTHSPQALPDKSLETFYHAIDQVQPVIFANLHSYLFRHKDELYTPDEASAQRFFRFMPDQIEFGKVWITNSSEQFGPQKYCHDHFGAESFLIEIPWFGRNASTMRLTGKRIVRALILMNTLKAGDSEPWGEF
jgi:hypothetical protein